MKPSFPHIEVRCPAIPAIPAMPSRLSAKRPMPFEVSCRDSLKSRRSPPHILPSGQVGFAPHRPCRFCTHPRGPRIALGRFGLGLPRLAMTARLSTSSDSEKPVYSHAFITCLVQYNSIHAPPSPTTSGFSFQNKLFERLWRSVESAPCEENGKLHANNFKQFQTNQKTARGPFRIGMYKIQE